MYLPQHFSEQRVNVLHDAIRAYPFGTLVTLQASAPQANHIPFLITPDPAPYGTLRGHIARANPLWKECTVDAEALIIFHGPQAYVSPSWYPSKSQHGKVVPTWNYVVVHAHGQPAFIHDETWLIEHVMQMTAQQEARMAVPWQVSDTPEGFVDRMLAGIVGIEIELNKLEGKWKLSQNRTAADRAGVISGLRDLDPQNALADLMADTSP